MTRQIPPALLAGGALIAQRVIVGKSTRRSPAVAAPVAVVSAGFLTAPLLSYRKAHTTVDPRAGATPSSLMTSGANSLSRNPMYVGMLGLLVANAIRLRSLRALIPAAAFGVWIDRVQIPAEEQVLAQRFGNDYVAYHRRTRRWLGLSA